MNVIKTHSSYRNAAISRWSLRSKRDDNDNYAGGSHLWPKVRLSREAKGRRHSKDKTCKFGIDKDSLNSGKYSVCRGHHIISFAKLIKLMWTSEFLRRSSGLIYPSSVQFEQPLSLHPMCFRAVVTNQDFYPFAILKSCGKSLSFKWDHLWRYSLIVKSKKYLAYVSTSWKPPTSTGIMRKLTCPFPELMAAR